MAETLPETPTPNTIEQIALQIKSMEQRTTSVTLPRNASVLDLKQEVQVAFDVDSNRQRLIFQGRVLKDDKNLTDYANLDNGKVVHLVIRPVDAPHNPLNGMHDPNPGANTRTNRAAPNGRSRTFPSISSRFPLMEGYAFITLDSTIGDIGDSQSLLTSMMNAYSSGRAPVSGITTGNNTSTTNTNGARASPGALPRTPFSFSFANGRNNNQSDFTSPIGTNPLTDRISSSLPFPPSVEVRLARTLGSMRNVRNMLEDSNITNDGANATHPPTASNPATPNSTPEQLQEIRNRLRNSGNSQSTQIGMVLNELADLMTEAVPRMRQVADDLREENQSAEQERITSRRVLNMSRIVQGMSLINHFLGSVLASADIETSRRSAQSNTNPSSTASTPSSTRSSPIPAAAAPNTARSTSTSSPSLVRLPSYLFPRGMTEAIRTNSPAAVRTAIPPSRTVSSPNVPPRKKEKSSLCTSCTMGESSTAETSTSTPNNTNTDDRMSQKRKLDDKEDQDQDASKKPKTQKGKEKKE
ncbi:hypothetical protein MAM1_0189d07615 [Mucor ambiguus]|uniref:Ubiquitin-like domain-containing protein n=1 Tax=Mucor ambiguus TaxID=91626 RepID=A0A0C9N0J3_9FUNG|nr:hypothetical protein MAM1_0189d07615 [Mucor ambiguus]